jgi:hypothetical protein
MMNYFTSLQSYPVVIQEALINEAPHTRFINIPEELDFLRKGIVDLGFENLGLDEKAFKEIMNAFVRGGVKIPGTPWKMRADDLFKSTIERVGQNEILPTLPDYWAEAVMTVDIDTNKVLYAGSRVRQNQLPSSSI